MSDNFKTCDKAWQYCKKYGLDNITAAYSFTIAESPLQAYKAGAKEHAAVSVKQEPQEVKKYKIGDLLIDEAANFGVVVIQWDDGDTCATENDTAHPSPRIIVDGVVESKDLEKIIDSFY